jgi:hypothetical protein
MDEPFNTHRIAVAAAKKKPPTRSVLWEEAQTARIEQRRLRREFLDRHPELPADWGREEEE